MAQDIKKNVEITLTGVQAMTKELKDAKNELAEFAAQGTATAEQIAAAEARVVAATEAIKDMNEQIAAVSGEPLEVINNNISGVIGNLKNLDFGKAAKQLDNVSGAVGKIKFKELGAGVKEFGGSMVNLGKSLLSNPLFLFATIITGIITAFYALRNEGGLIGNMFKFIGKIVEGAKKVLIDFTDTIGLTNSKAAAEAKKAEEERQKIADKAEENAKSIDEKIKERAFQRELAARKEKLQLENLLGLQNKQKQLITESSTLESQVLTALNRDKNSLSKTELRILELNEQKLKLNYAEQEVVKELTDKKLEANKKELEDEQKKMNEKSALRVKEVEEILDAYFKEAEAIKILRDAQGEYEDFVKAKREAENKATAKTLFDTLNSFKILNAQRKGDIEEEFKLKADKINQDADLEVLAAKGNAEAILNINKNRDIQLQQNEIELEEARKERLASYLELVNNGIGALNDLFQTNIENQLQQVEFNKNAELEAIEAKLERTEKGSQEEKDLQKQLQETKEKFAKQEYELKKKQFNMDKAASIAEIGIQTALGIMKASPNIPLQVATGVLGAVQAAIAASKQYPPYQGSGSSGSSGSGTGIITPPSTASTQFGGDVVTNPAAPGGSGIGLGPGQTQSGSTRVYVLASDITGVQNSIKTAVEDSTFG